VLRGDGLAVPDPLADDVQRVVLGQFGLARASQVLKNLRPRLEAGAAEDSDELSPQVGVGTPIPRDHELRLRTAFCSRRLHVGAQLGKDWDHASRFAFMTFGLWRMNGDSTLSPVDVRPAKREMFAGATKAAKAAQSKQQPPLGIRASVQNPRRICTCNKVVSGPIGPNADSLHVAERILRHKSASYCITKELASERAAPSNGALGEPLVGSKPAAPIISVGSRNLFEWLCGSKVCDGLHRRIVKKRYSTGALSETRHYYYNVAWQVVEERLESGGSIDSDPINQYVWHPHYVDALAMRRYDADVDPGTTNADYYYLQDANFNVTAIANSSGAIVERYAYTPYGSPTILNGANGADPDGSVTEWAADSSQSSSDVGNTSLFTGREYDWETGLQLNRRRFYASHLGRWTSRDPIGYRGGDANLYGYVRGMPTYYMDPWGLEQCGFSVWLYAGSWCVEDNVWDAATGEAGDIYTEQAGDAHQALENLGALGNATRLCPKTDL
jgi:RHS repeat-associated protein